MPPLSREDLEQALQRIQEFRDQIDNNSQAERMLNGTLYELNIHFLQRAMPYSYCFDLDFIVLGFNDKEPIPQALVEVKTEKGKLSKNQQTIYLKIAKALDIPAFLLIYYNNDKYKIKNLETEEDLGFFNYNELTKWFQDLSGFSVKKEILPEITRNDNSAIFSVDNKKRIQKKHSSIPMADFNVYNIK